MKVLVEKLCTDLFTSSCSWRVRCLMWFAVCELWYFWGIPWGCCWSLAGSPTPSPLLGQGQTWNGLRTGENCCPAKGKLLRAYTPLLYQVLLDTNPCLSLIFVCFLSGSLKLFPAYVESLCISFVSFQLKSTNYKSTFSQVKTCKIL